MSENTLVQRLVALIETMREDSLRNLELFLSSVDSLSGGALLLQAPCKYRGSKRDLAEAGYCSEKFREIL